MSAEELTDGFPCRSHGPMFTQGNEYELISITSLLGPRLSIHSHYGRTFLQQLSRCRTRARGLIGVEKVIFYSVFYTQSFGASHGAVTN